MDKTDTSGPLTKAVQSRLVHGDVSGEYFFLELAERGDGEPAVAFGGRERCASDYQLHRHTFPFVTLEVVAAGEGQIQFGRDRPLTLRAGNAYAYGPGMEVRMAAAAQGMTKYFVCLTGAGVRDCVSDPINLWGSCVHLGDYHALQETLDLMLHEGREHIPKVEALCWISFRRLLVQIEQGCMRRGDPPEPSREAFVRCRTIVAERYRELNSLDEWAQQAGVSLPSLHRLFRRFQGVTPYRFLTRQKMNHAARDLISTDQLVKQIAADTGYEDPLHFSRVFRQTHGVSPAQWREMWKADSS